MTDNQAFKPFVPEKQITVVITKREAILLTKLRRHAYGKVVVHKINGMIVRVESQESELIDENQESNL